MWSDVNREETMKNRTGLILAMAFAAASGLAQSAFVTDVLALNPQGYWRLDGNAFDATLFGSNGSANNGLTFTGQGGGAPMGDPRNAAASLVGSLNQYISIPARGTLFTLEWNSAFTMMIWVKTSYAAHDMFLLAKAENSGNFRGPGIIIDNGDTPGISTPKGGGRFGFTLSDGPNDYFQVDSLAAVNDGNWHLLVATYDGSGGPGGVKLYIDAAAASATTVVNLFSRASTLNSSPGTIGSRHGGGMPYTGLLDEAAIFPVALTTPQIHQLANDAPQPST